MEFSFIGVGVNRFTDNTQNDGVLLYQYCSLDAIQSSYDQFYFNVEDIYEEWNCEIEKIDQMDPDQIYGIVFIEES